MARSKRRRKGGRKRVELPLDALSEFMREHVRALQMESVDAYLAWCRRHRFEQSVTKSAVDRQRERLQRLRDRAGRHDHDYGRLRNAGQLVRDLLRGNCERVPREYLAIATALQSSEPATAVAEGALLRKLLTRMLAVAPRMLERDAETLSVLPRLLAHRERCVRDPMTWLPRSRNERRNLQSLICHLFARYDVPPCLLACWFEDGADAARRRSWFLHVGAGNNLRTADLPIEFTKKMAHWFVTAPPTFDVSAALRFGQVLGLGGCQRLAHSICTTRLGRRFEHDAFWRTVIAFLVQHDIVDAMRVTSIVDFVHEHRFASDDYVDEFGRQRTLPPIQPNLTMAGRCPHALLRQIDAWHGRLRRGRGTNRNLRWSPSQIAGYRERERIAGTPPKERLWTIHELCSGAELRHEGSRMRHCVFTYSRWCANGDSRIFSLRFEQDQKVHHRATIEVADGAVTQIRGPRNDDVMGRERELLERWFAGAGLKVRSYAW